MAQPNKSMSYGEADRFGKFIITGTDAKRKEVLDRSFGKRPFICDYLENNYQSHVEVVKTKQRDIKLVNYHAEDLMNLIEASEIPISRKGRRYIEDNTNFNGTINRELFCIAIELYGDISKLREYCKTKSTSK